MEIVRNWVLSMLFDRRGPWFMPLSHLSTLTKQRAEHPSQDGIGQRGEQSRELPDQPQQEHDAGAVLHHPSAAHLRSTHPHPPVSPLWPGACYLGYLLAELPWWYQERLCLDWRRWSHFPFLRDRRWCNRNPRWRSPWNTHTSQMTRSAAQFTAYYVAWLKSSRSKA